MFALTDGARGKADRMWEKMPVKFGYIPINFLTESTIYIVNLKLKKYKEPGETA